jgi:prefoldin subunit 5
MVLRVKNWFRFYDVKLHSRLIEKQIESIGSLIKTVSQLQTNMACLSKRKKLSQIKLVHSGCACNISGSVSSNTDKTVLNVGIAAKVL